MFLKNLLLFLLLKPKHLNKHNYSTNIGIFFIKNDFFLLKKYSLVNQNYIYLNSGYLNNLSIISNLFSSGVNFLFLDKDFNFNYLPVPNPTTLKKKTLSKVIRFFDIRVIFFFNLKKKNFKNFFDLKLINITPNNKIPSTCTDVNFAQTYLNIHHYIYYIFSLNILLKSIR